MVKTYRQLLEQGIEMLRENSIEDETLNAKELMGKALNINCRSAEFASVLDKTAQNQAEKNFCNLIDRRIKGEPLQYLVGEWEFYGLTFKVGKGVLIPRQDTETVVETVINKLKGRKNISAADLCSGTGCIALALEKNISFDKLFCVENSDKAMEYLKDNISFHNSKAQAVKGDVLDENFVNGMPEFDLITANPPYLTKEDMENLQKEVGFEPEYALFGGEDGLDFYRTIVRLWKNRLKEGGMIAFEVGINQEDEVMCMLIQHGFENVRCKADMCGVNRCVFGIKPISVQGIGQKIDFDKLSVQADS